MATLGQERRTQAQRIWRAGVDAVRPQVCLPAALSGFSGFDLKLFERVLVVGGGKAGAAMAAALEEALPKLGVSLERVQGVVNVPNETARPLRRIRLHPARPMGVNHPTAEAVEGTRQMLRLAEAAGPNDLLLCLISGGGSALLCAPAPGLSLSDKQAVTKLLHQCGADIAAMNCVRKHLSLVKGGGLAQRFFAAGVGERRLLSLVISDVMGDPLDVIASGPAVPDPTTFAEALDVLDRFKLLSAVPPAVAERMRAGVIGGAPETLKQTPTAPDGSPAITTLLAANSGAARAAAAAAAQAEGFETLDLGDVGGDTAAAAREFARLILQLKARGTGRPLCAISGGETTVVLPPDAGKGGRNQELALALARELGAGLDGVTILCGGTDGEDGPTDAAGAVVDAALLSGAAQAGLDVDAALRRHDAYPLLDRAGGLLRTGLTDTNVMDLRLFLLEAGPDSG